MLAVVESSITIASSAGGLGVPSNTRPSGKAGAGARVAAGVKVEVEAAVVGWGW